MATSTEGFEIRLPEAPKYGPHYGTADLAPHGPGYPLLTFHYDPAAPDLPALPVRHFGEFSESVAWIVDALGDCWMTVGHGPMERVDQPTLIRAAHWVGHAVEMDIRRIFGLLPAMPSWEWGALHQGWTPPTGWDPCKYDPTTIPNPKSPLISKYLNQKG